MAPRPIWQGHLKLSLVSCPVALHTGASSSGDVRFNLINPETNNRVRMIATDAETGEPVERSALLKGYQIAKGQYVTLTQEEIKAVKLESTKTIEIERFVPAGEIDRVYWDHPYYLVPDGKLGAEAFAVIREAMERAGEVALGRVVLSSRERLLALEPRGKGIVATSLRTRDEVRDPDALFDEIPNVRADKEMIVIAQKIIEQKHAAFDPSKFNDRYEDALRDLIARKRKGQKIVAAEAPEDTNVVDLMEALKKSLGGGARRAATRAAPAQTRKRAAAAGAKRARRQTAK
ncbi:MAG: Ku protein [Hyphomonadaceae bacterium]